MKTVIIVFGLLLLPSLSFAAPLTQDQASSLISVVQSSPQTPSSAFVPLITTFSNITQIQAESLISVVQASPNTPPSAFINLLISFTVDTIIQTPVIQQPVQTQSVQAAPKIEELVITPKVEAPVITPTKTAVASAESINQNIQANQKSLLGKFTITTDGDNDILLRDITISLSGDITCDNGKNCFGAFSLVDENGTLAAKQGTYDNDFPVDVRIHGSKTISLYGTFTQGSKGTVQIKVVGDATWGVNEATNMYIQLKDSIQLPSVVI